MDMTREEAIKMLEEESCYECSWGCESPVKCDCPKCKLKDAIEMAVEALKEQRPHGEWEHLKEHITELRDANGYATQYGTCQFILNLMNVIEKEGGEK